MFLLKEPVLSFEKKHQHNLGLITIKLPAITINRLILTRLISFLSVYDY